MPTFEDEVKSALASQGDALVEAVRDIIDVYAIRCYYDLPKTIEPAKDEDKQLRREFENTLSSYIDRLIDRVAGALADSGRFAIVPISGTDDLPDDKRQYEMQISELPPEFQALIQRMLRRTKLKDYYDGNLGNILRAIECTQIDWAAQLESAGEMYVQLNKHLEEACDIIKNPPSAAIPEADQPFAMTVLRVRDPER
jgi:trehalose-6-phosphate synthase